MTNPARPECDTCGKVMSVNQVVVKHVASVFVSVDLLQQLRDGIL